MLRSVADVRLFKSRSYWPGIQTRPESTLWTWTGWALSDSSTAFGGLGTSRGTGVPKREAI